MASTGGLWMLAAVALLLVLTGLPAWIVLIGVSVIAAVAARCTGGEQAVQHTLFGPPPHTDDDLLHLAHALDDIERQVTR